MTPVVTPGPVALPTYYAVFGGASAVTFLLVLVASWASSTASAAAAASSSSSAPSSAEGSAAAVAALRRRYLAVYLLAFLGDWCQGPYVYALYESYGYSEGTIEALFVAGFGSSMLFGTFIGGLADRIGRKRAALMYCAVYVSCCATKHFDNLGVLLLGRVLGGVATSLLFSVFESWMVHEHGKILSLIHI